MGWIVSPQPKFKCWSPEIQYLRMWLYFGDASLACVIRVGPNSTWLVSLEKMEFGHTDIRVHMHRGTIMWNDSKRVAISLRERPQRTPTLPASWSWTSSLQKSNKINFCCWSYPVFVYCYGSTTKLIQRAFGESGLSLSFYWEVKSFSVTLSRHSLKSLQLILSHMPIA